MVGAFSDASRAVFPVAPPGILRNSWLGNTRLADSTKFGDLRENKEMPGRWAFLKSAL